MENARMMILHALIIGVVLYLVMVFLLKQSPVVAETRSILIASIVLAYMVVFGHKLPMSVNKNLL